jgi:hypothetical protein
MMDALRATRSSDRPGYASDGEINFLWAFIQGGMMNVPTWQHLMRAWGFCERHAWIALSVEMAFRHRYLLGPAILYRALVEQAVEATSPTAVVSPQRAAARRLAERGPCIICDAGIRGPGAMPPARIERGRNVAPLRLYAEEYAPVWQPHTCPVCWPDAGGARPCRRHLIARLRRGGSAELAAEHGFLAGLARHVDAYGRSFVWEHTGSDTAEDRASLIAAVGWCSGWAPLMRLLEAGAACFPAKAGVARWRA